MTATFLTFKIKLQIVSWVAVVLKNSTHLVVQASKFLRRKPYVCTAEDEKLC